VLRWFKKQSSVEQPLRVDIHSHLLPALDDGVASLEEAEKIILRFEKLGYQKLITTPHIMSDAYRNTPAIIDQKLKELKAHLLSKNIAIEIQAAAEYYLDEVLFHMLEDDQSLLTLGKNYLLFETNFLTEPFPLKDFIFKAITKGYKPILAHPERYVYLQNDFTKAQDLLDRGVLFQLNISSLTGYYSKPAQQMAFKLIDRGYVHWLGSDCHHLRHVDLMEEALTSRYWKKALTLPLLNNSLE
jgi:protein-tyrosine phosphatase